MKWFCSAVAICVLLMGCGVGQDVPPEKRLAERAEQRWQMLIEGDFRRAYDFLAPGFRDTTPLERYRGGFGAMVGWQAATVSDVRVDQALGRAAVTLKLEYRAADPTGNTMLDTARGLKETWLLIDGEWFFSPD